VWARRETIAFASWRCKVHGALFVIGCILVIPFSRGMPWHAYWKWIGVPILLATVLYPFPGLLLNAAMLLGELLESSKGSTKVRNLPPRDLPQA